MKDVRFRGIIREALLVMWSRLLGNTVWTIFAIIERFLWTGPPSGLATYADRL